MTKTVADSEEEVADASSPGLEQARSAGEAFRRARAGRPFVVGTVVFGLPIILALALVAGLTPVSPVRVIVIGLQAGSVTSLVALGVALVYKATRVLNFAQGAFGTVAAFLAYSFMVGGELGDISLQPDASMLWWTSLVAVAAGAVVAILVNVLVVQRLAEASQVTSLVATVGIALGFTAIQVIVFQAQARPFPRYVSGFACFGPEVAEPGTFALCPLVLGGITVSWHTIIVISVLAIAAGLLALFFQTRLGVALLATAQEPFAAELQGVSVRGMATLAWGMAGALGALAGLLGAGNYEQLTPGLMTSTFLIPAFTGAILGGITSMVGAVVGGLLIGITTTMANEFVLAYGLNSVLPGPPDIAVLLVLLLVLLLRPAGLFGKEA